MCNRIKSAKLIRCAQTVYWDLINSNINRDGLSMSVSFISWNKNRSENDSNNIISLCGVDSAIL